MRTMQACPSVAPEVVIVMAMVAAEELVKLFHLEVTGTVPALEVTVTALTTYLSTVMPVIGLVPMAMGPDMVPPTVGNGASTVTGPVSCGVTTMVEVPDSYGTVSPCIFTVRKEPLPT